MVRYRRTSTDMTDADIRQKVSSLIYEVTGDHKTKSQKFMRGIMRLIRKIKSETYIAGLVKGKSVPALPEAKKRPEKRWHNGETFSD